ncbi:hypothetical protein [Turneriella parva]|uniref:Glycosyltransferase RgtA/B/C/D-like domain-containing protein n=1 Tax=Turneriella parva (strain ATCC BAA-1111 / DSM 21527 / NCTC 11395 / H) TaxID=869212 RepID=I4B4Q7_TURPD|nr:hypothetical protein [Turneriella parva]AFM12264.1 hypothetical protein Turpa_1616 [Turneriella parva DSM 21527]
MILIVRDHRHLILVLAVALVLFVAFPFQLQSMEAYSYAAAIEKYYNLSTTFALAQGEYLPDFGRYHPNHPLGHVLAGIAFDWFKVPALSWIRFTNIFSTLAAAVFVYLLALQMRFSKGVSNAATALFLTTHSSLLAVFSGEWHMPSLALSLAGTWQVFAFALSGTKRRLYVGAFLLCVAVCYHTAALSYSVCLVVLLGFVRKNEWRHLLLVCAGALFVIGIVYFVVPFFVLQIEHPSDFLRTFFIYAHLDYERFGGFTWLWAAMQTIFHGFIFIPATIPVMNWFAVPFFMGIGVAAWRFFYSNVQIPIKIFCLFMLFGWPIALAIAGTRANAIYSWIFLSPLLCLLVAFTLRKLHAGLMTLAWILAIFLITWNFSQLVMPNHFYKRENVHLFKLPETMPKTKPVVFVVNDPVLTVGEIWYAGSELNYRNQNIFYPCCGEDSYLFRLRRWLTANPEAIVVSDGSPEQIEEFFNFQKLSYVRWLDQHVTWPAALLPATLYFIREPEYKYHKRLIIWLPQSKMTAY